VLGIDPGSELHAQACNKVKGICQPRPRGPSPLSVEGLGGVHEVGDVLCEGLTKAKDVGLL
jgi:hypothetical protein